MIAYIFSKYYGKRSKKSLIRHFFLDLIRAFSARNFSICLWQKHSRISSSIILHFFIVTLIISFIIVDIIICVTVLIVCRFKLFVFHFLTVPIVFQVLMDKTDYFLLIFVQNFNVAIYMQEMRRNFIFDVLNIFTVLNLFA